MTKTLVILLYIILKLMLPSYILHIWYYFIGHFRDPVINQPVFHGLDLFVCRQLLVEETILGTKMQFMSMNMR